MSRIIATAAIRGAHAIYARAEKTLNEAIETHGEDRDVEFPNTGYYLPVIYAMTGEEVKTLKDLKPILARAKEIIPPVPPEKRWLPYLGWALDAGMATLWCDEIIEIAKYLEDPPPMSFRRTVPTRENSGWARRMT